MAAKIGKQVHIRTPNKVGMLAEVTGAIAGAGVNIDTLAAFVADNKANFMVITNNNAKTIDALKAYEVKEEDVVVVELENKIGAATDMANKLKDAEIDLKYIYGTTSGSGPVKRFYRWSN